MTASDRAAHVFAIKTMAAYFLAFCLGVLFTVICQGALT